MIILLVHHRFNAHVLLTNNHRRFEGPTSPCRRQKKRRGHQRQATHLHQVPSPLGKNVPKGHDCTFTRWTGNAPKMNIYPPWNSQFAAAREAIPKGNFFHLPTTNFQVLKCCSLRDDFSSFWRSKVLFSSEFSSKKLQLLIRALKGKAPGRDRLPVYHHGFQGFCCFPAM